MFSFLVWPDYFICDVEELIHFDFLSDDYILISADLEDEALTFYKNKYG